MANYSFMKHLGVAVVKGALRPTGIVDVVEAVYDAYGDWSREKREQERVEEFQAIVSSTLQELRQQVQSSLDEVRRTLKPGDLSKFDADRTQIENILLQVPAMTQRVWRRRTDPSGRTPPQGTRLASPEELAAHIPDRVVRFKAGDRPIEGYEVDQLLGHGGFSEVWLAHNIYAPAKKVAIKFPSVATPVGFKESDNLLAHEVAIVNKLMQAGATKGVLPIELVNTQSNPPYIIYPYIRGGDLAGIIREWTSNADQSLSGERLAKHQHDNATRAHRTILRLAEIMTPVHRSNIVHRDMKPSNILVEPAGSGEFELFVADFGIGMKSSAATLANTSRMTSQLPLQTTRLRGSCTPIYASPEQQHGSDGPDPRDDVHAIGVMWYQLLIGDVAKGVPPDWHRKLKKDLIGEDFIDVFALCIASDRHERIRDCEELAQKLRQCFRNRDKQWQETQKKSRAEQEKSDWQLASKSGRTNVAALKEFVEKYPDSSYHWAAKGEIEKAEQAQRAKRLKRNRTIGYVVIFGFLGTVLFGGGGALLGSIGLNTVGAAILGLVVGVVVGAMAGSFIGASFSSYANGHQGCCQYHWGRVDGGTVKVWAIIGMIIGGPLMAIQAVSKVGTTQNISMVSESGQYAAPTLPAGFLPEFSTEEGAIYGGLIGLGLGLVTGLIVAAVKNKRAAE